jgi:hypothetical protein
MLGRHENRPGETAQAGNDMTAIAQQCGGPDPEDKCERLRAQIRRIIFQTKEECGTRGLKERIMDQIYGANGPGAPGRIGHHIAIENMQNQLTKLMKDFSDNQCGDKTPIGNDAKQWMNRPNPAPSEWKGPAKAVPVQHSIFDWKYWKQVTGLSGVALGLYLIVSEGSRLFPPRNLVPIP